MNIPLLVTGALFALVVLKRGVGAFVSRIDYDVKRLKFKLIPPGAVMTLAIKNRNAQSVTIGALNGVVYHQGGMLGTFSALQPVTLTPNETVTYDINVTITAIAAIQTISNMIAAGGLPVLKVEVKGNTQVNGVNIPFSTTVGYQAIQ